MKKISDTYWLNWCACAFRRSPKTKFDIRKNPDFPWKLNDVSQAITTEVIAYWSYRIYSNLSAQLHFNEKLRRRSIIVHFRGMDTRYQRRQLCQNCLPSSKGSVLKGKSLLPIYSERNDLHPKGKNLLYKKEFAPHILWKSKIYSQKERIWSTWEQSNYFQSRWGVHTFLEI